MSAELAGFVLGTPDPPALAGFYRELLGWNEVSMSSDWARLRSPQQERPGISFQLETEHRPPVWPPRSGTQQMQAHLDIQVNELVAEVERAVELGATVEDHQPQEGVRVLRDPHGHLLCLFLPGH